MTSLVNELAAYGRKSVWGNPDFVIVKQATHFTVHERYPASQQIYAGEEGRGMTAMEAAIDADKRRLAIAKVLNADTAINVKVEVPGVMK